MKHTLVPAGAKLIAVMAMLGTQTACLEHFTALETTVQYDAFDQTFQVRRVLRNVSPGFFGCVDLADCSEAVGRAVQLQPAPFPTALSDRLVQRLIESGAEGVTVTLEPDGEQLDAVVSYSAPVGSAAAEDTLVHAEWDGRKGYYLVVDADASLRPLDVRARVRKTAASGPEGTDWREAWVLKPRTKSVTTFMDVDETVRPLFAHVAGLEEQLAARGWLDGNGIVPDLNAVATAPAPAPTGTPPDIEPVPSAPAGVDEAPAPNTAVAPVPEAPAPSSPVAAPLPDPAPAPASVTSAPLPDPPLTPLPAPTRSWPAPDLTHPARTYVYDARVSGGGISVAAANVSAEPLIPRAKVCYQEAVQRDPAVAGSAFLSALVAADGSLVSTSVYGSVGDRSLMQCLEMAMEGWRFTGWGGEGVADVAIPLVFRVEAAPAGKRRKKRK